MQAVILAGGAGSRLRPIVSDRPKPMAAFGARPFLEYQIESLRRHDITDILLCVGYMHEHIQDYFGDGSRCGVRVRYSVETTPLGTGGALRQATPLLDSTFLLLNGDSYLDLDWAAFRRAHAAHAAADPRCVGSLALAHVDDASAYGAVALAADQRVRAFGEKSQHGAAWINAGIYVLDRAGLARWPESTPLSLERDGLPAILAAGDHLYGYPAPGFFVDIGTPAGHDAFHHYVTGQAS